jgi:catechol 2,3-dioxygenase
VLYVHDVERMIDFYTNTLGFEVTDRGPLGDPDGGVEIVFLSQTANHHHQVAFITGRDEPDASNNVHHVAFRSAGTLDDLKALNKTLEADAEVTEIIPLCHGNAWSVYFRDPEFNGVEVFIDTPWHVRQPQGAPLDLDKSNDEIVESTRAHFSNEPEFGSIDDFYERRAEHLGQR